MSLDNLGPYIPEQRDNLSEKYQDIISGKEILAQTWLDKQELLENMLEDGLIIENISQLDTLKNLLSRNNIFYLKNISQDDFNNIWEFSIKKVGEVIKIFPMVYSMKIWENWPFSQAFEISKDWEIQKKLDRTNQIDISHLQNIDSWLDNLNKKLSQWDEQTNYVLDPNFKEETSTEHVTEESQKWAIQKSTSNMQNNINDVIVENKSQNENFKENKESNETSKCTSYEVKKWDTLWKIIREQYGVSDFTDIANILYKITQFNQKNNSWENKVDFSKPDDLKISQQLLLPDNIVVISPTKWEKTFILQ